MTSSYNVLILGASYGSLLATKLAMAGHDVTLVCLPAEAEAINRNGAVVRLPVKGREPVEIRSKTLPGKISAEGPSAVKPGDYELVGLAMQEPQYRSSGVRELMDAIARTKVPCMSIMNMPPLTYLRRIPGLNADGLKSAYTDPAVWQGFDPAYMTLCSPDPQAFRPPEDPVNVLQVTLPTNFKVARFDSDQHTRMLRDMQAGIEAIRWDSGGEKIELPVKLKVHDSVFVPLAKWAMLLTGNYRCITKDGPRSIKEAVHTNPEESRAVYDWVREVCIKLGASSDELVPFEKYAAAAEGLMRPSSAARALFAGAPNIERVDRLVQGIAAQQGMRLSLLDEMVAVVDAKLTTNRKVAA
jgi:hypothetical protein